MDALKIALLPIKERRKEKGLTLEQMSQIEKDEERILMEHFDKFIHYSGVVNQAFDRRFIGFIGKTCETINRIQNQIDAELTKFFKKYFTPNRAGTELYEEILKYMSDESIYINYASLSFNKSYTFNYCLMVNDYVDEKCACCDYEQMFEEHRVL